MVNKSSGATALQGLGRQSGRRRSAKLVPTFADRGVSWLSNFIYNRAPLGCVGVSGGGPSVLRG